jgi:hypothetical protein
MLGHLTLKPEMGFISLMSPISLLIIKLVMTTVVIIRSIISYYGVRIFGNSGKLFRHRVGHYSS